MPNLRHREEAGVRYRGPPATEKPLLGADSHLNNLLLDYAEKALSSRAIPNKSVRFLGRIPADQYRPSLCALPDHVPKVQYDAGEIVLTVSPTRSYIAFKEQMWNVLKPSAASSWP